MKRRTLGSSSFRRPLASSPLTPVYCTRTSPFSHSVLLPIDFSPIGYYTNSSSLVFFETHQQQWYNPITREIRSGYVTAHTLRYTGSRHYRNSCGYLLRICYACYRKHLEISLALFGVMVDFYGWQKSVWTYPYISF